MKNKIAIKFLIFGVLPAVIAASIFMYREKFEEKKVSIELDKQAAEEIVDADNEKQEIFQEDVFQDEAIQKETKSGDIINIQNNSTEISPETKVPQEKVDSAVKTEVAKSNSFKIVNRLMSGGYQKSSGRKIDTVIIHSSYDALGDDPFDVGGIIDEYKDYGVSAHYLIGRDGTIYRLVEEKNIAWHAGVAKVPDGRTDVNSFSIGIEMINTKTDKFTSDQYSALNKLLGQIKSNYDIKYVLGHDQVAPGRKDDPWNIEWGKVKK